MEIAIALADIHPQIDPKTIRFTDLHRWVLALPGFDDAADRSNEKILETIQMAWHEEFQDRQD